MAASDSASTAIELASEAAPLATAASDSASEATVWFEAMLVVFTPICTGSKVITGILP